MGEHIQYNPEPTVISPESDHTTPYDLLVVLGKNWHNRWAIPSEPSLGTTIQLSEDSMRSAIAAAELFMEGRVNNLLFSTGHTLGEEYPTEAEAMIDYMRQFYTEDEVPSEAVFAETVSHATPSNMKQVRKMLEEGMFQSGDSEDINTAILTVDYHAKRAGRLGVNWGVITSQSDVFCSEDVLRDRGFDLKERTWAKRIKEAFVETPQRLLLTVDPKGVLPNEATRLIRK